jgi:hypothetical protein
MKDFLGNANYNLEPATSTLTLSCNWRKSRRFYDHKACRE